MSAPILRLRGVSKSFDAGGVAVHALDAVNLDVDAGEGVAVMGPSGSGKTTLLTIAGALQHPTSGQVELEGISLNDKSEPELARIRRERIGFIFQSFNLLERRTP